MNKEDFREWHDVRLKICAYPAAIVQELKQAREQWLSRTNWAPDSYSERFEDLMVNQLMRTSK